MNESSVILHLDDDEDCLALSRSSFERAVPNAELLTRADPAAALATLAVEPVDVVISDSVELADGRPFVEAARNEYPDVPIVLYTGSDFSEVAPVVARTGVTEYVQKRADGPFRTLVDRVERLVEEESSLGTDRFRVTSPSDSAGSESSHDEAADLASDDWTELARCDPTSVEDLVATLVDVLGDRADEQPLLELFDVEALSELFSSQDDTVPVQFRVRLDTHEVAVTSDGTVASRPLTSA